MWCDKVYNGYVGFVDSRGPGTQDRGGYSDRGPSSRDVGWQGGQHSSNVVDDRNKRNTGYQPNPGPGLLG